MGRVWGLSDRGVGRFCWWLFWVPLVLVLGSVGVEFGFRWRGITVWLVVGFGSLLKNIFCGMVFSS